MNECPGCGTLLPEEEIHNCPICRLRYRHYEPYDGPEPLPIPQPSQTLPYTMTWEQRMLSWLSVQEGIDLT